MGPKRGRVALTCAAPLALPPLDAVTHGFAMGYRVVAPPGAWCLKVNEITGQGTILV